MITNSNRAYTLTKWLVVEEEESDGLPHEEMSPFYTESDNEFDS